MYDKNHLLTWRFRPSGTLSLCLNGAATQDMQDPSGPVLCETSMLPLPVSLPTRVDIHQLMASTRTLRGPLLRAVVARINFCIQNSGLH
jgi:hypothetical protein